MRRPSNNGTNLAGLALAMADQACSYCHGLGRCAYYDGGWRPCRCVWRAVFSACWRRYRLYEAEDPRRGLIVEFLPGRGFLFSRKR